MSLSPTPSSKGPFFLPWCLALVALVRSVTQPKMAMPWVVALVVIFSVLSVFYAKGMIPPTPKKLSIWAVLFFMSESMAHALFYAAGLFAMLGLFRSHRSDSFHPLLVWGFIAYTVAQVTGAIWCFRGLGQHLQLGRQASGLGGHLDFFCRGVAPAVHCQMEALRGAVMVIAGAAMVFYISYGHYFHEMHFQRVGG
jgi:hypothetical protein